MDSISEFRLGEVHPVLAQRVRNLVAQLPEYTFRVTAGIRTVEQQDRLYAQGRTEPGPVVTNARGTESNHVLGFAVDLCVMVDGEPDWDSPGFDHIVELASSCGLRSGAAWNDRPHVELEEVPEKPADEMQQIYLEAGVLAVWNEVNLA